jgi:exo-beta-1,3-glucanase (GH17 family)
MFRKISVLILCALVFTPSLFGASTSWGTEKPWIVIDSVPEIGGGDSVRGHIEFDSNGSYGDYRISMALEVVRGSDRWAPKPTYDQPAVEIGANGNFSCLFVSGGQDHIAERLFVYLIPASFTPNGDTSRTEEVALDVVIIDRYEGRVDIRQKYPAALKHPIRTKKISLNYSPYTKELSPEKNSAISAEHVRRQLELIHPYTDTIKIFGVTGELTKIYQIAKEEFHFRVIGGCWIDEYSSEDDIKNELDTLIDLTDKGYIDIALVGSETIFRGDFSVEDLVTHIQYAREKIESNILVGTADTPAAFWNYPALVEVCDVVCVNIYPFHNGIKVGTAIQDLSATYKTVADVVAAAGKKIIVTETGWPSEGTPKGDAIPNDANSGKYFEDVYDFSREEDIEIVWFSSYSEPWKAANAYIDYEAHFGLFTSDEKLKEQFEPILRTILDRPSNGDKSSEGGEPPAGGCVAASGIREFANLFFVLTGFFVFVGKRLKKRRSA